MRRWQRMAILGGIALTVAVSLSGCRMTATPASGWTWPTTGPVTPAPTPLRVTPAILPTPTARNLTPATAVPIAPTPTATATALPTLAPTDTTVPPTVAPPAATTAPPTSVPPAATAVPTATVTVPTRAPTSTAIRGTLVRPTSGTSTAVATTAATLPVVIEPTPTPAYPIYEAFRSAWREYPSVFAGNVSANHLGQPLEAPWTEQVSRQFFGSFTRTPCTAAYALLLWRESTSEIYFLAGNSAAPGGDTCLDTWEAYPDTWATGQGNNEDLTPPPGLVTPVMGFGRVWREFFYGRSDAGLGFATGPELYTTATVQRFENGVALHFPDTDEVYVLFPAYRSLDARGEAVGRVWFRNPRGDIPSR